MTLQTMMNELAFRGTARNRRIYARYGVRAPLFGVSWADLRALAKKLGGNHALAVELWATGNHDARILATMTADPQQVDAALAGSWARDCDNYVITDAVSKLLAQAACARELAEAWSAERQHDFVGQLGWDLVGCLALAGGLPDAYFEARIATIEREIHSRANRTRHAMNMALCAIGIGRESLRARALRAARRIGPVQVDHGQTGCKTPPAAEYIEHAVAQKATLSAARRT